jgi:VCBS repeat-containing protein
MLVLALIRPLALASHAVAWPTNASATTPTEPELVAQLQNIFPTLAPDLATRAEFAPATRLVDGQMVVGLAIKRQADQAGNSLDLFFPSHYDAPFVVASKGLQLSMRALDAQPALAQIEDGTLAYRGVYRATDSVELASAAQSKEFLLLRSPAAPTRFRYALQAGAGAAATLDQGAVRIADAQGHTLRIPAPWLVDATGRRNEIAAHWELGAAGDGAQILTLALDPRGLSYPLALDPSFSNSSSITIPDSGASTPYPSSITDSGMSGVLSKVTVQLTNISHTFPDDLDILLVGPAGQNVLLMSDTGGGYDIINTTLTFDDAAAANLADDDQLATGTFLPTDFETDTSFPSPAPSGTYGTSLSVFNGTNPNGVWKLFVFDDAGGDTGSIAGGWTLNLTTNSAPVANAGSRTLFEDTLGTGTLSATDADSNPLTYSIVTNGCKGVAMITNASTGAFTYYPNPNANGSDSFTFKVNDGFIDSNVATFTITITPIDDAPVAYGGSLTVFEDSLAAGTLSASDVEGDSLTYSIVTNGSKGVAVITNASTGAFTYYANPNANGSDSFTYRVNDGMVNSNPAPVSVTINPVNDAPVAYPSSLTTNEDTAATGTLSASDVDGDSLTYSIVTNGSKGVAAITNASTGAFSYTPNPNANGSDSFTFRVNDGTLNSFAATVSITITPVNDIPVANAGNLTLNEDFFTIGTLSASDVDGNSLTYSIVTDGAKGHVAIGNASTGTFSYSPYLNANGSDSFTFKVNDGTLDSNIATVSITITPVNDMPLAFPSSLTTNEDTAASSALIAIDPDGDSLTYSIVANGSKGVATITNVATGAYTYTPNADVNGTDSFTFKVNDGTAASNVATVNVMITPVNDAPAFTKGADQSLDEDADAQSVSGWATGISAGPSDESSQTLQFLVANDNTALFSSQPAIAPDGTLSYTPAAEAHGSATVTVQLQDDGGTANEGVDTSAAQTFTIMIAPVNDAPTFTKGADQSLDEDADAQSVSGWATGISAGPSDESSQTLQFLVANDNTALFSSQPAIAPNGTLSYTPVAEAHGSATVTIQLQDDGGTANSGSDTSAAQTFTITIAPVNDAPVATDGSLTTTEDTAANGTLVASDIEGNSLTYSIVANGSKGVATITNANAGAFSYTPNANANGADSFTFQATDGSLASQATVSITITPVDDAPTLNTTADVSVLESAPLQSIELSGISAGPADENGQSLTVTAQSTNPMLIASPTVSYTSPNATATLSFTPTPGLSGAAPITVIVTDSGSGIAPHANRLVRTFLVFVGAVNNRPTLDQPADVSLLEDAGAQTISLSGIGAGSSAETGQSLTVTAVSSNPALIANPSVSYTSPNASATLSYQPAANVNGTATITVTVRDDGGTLNGGIDVVERAFTITVTPVNDAPSFTAGTNQTVSALAGSQTVAGWVSTFTPGPADEASQTVLAYQVVSNSNPALFAVAPTVAADGTLSYTPAVGVGGTATIGVTVRDTGGTANGGTDTSVVKTFTITIGAGYRTYLPLVTVVSTSATRITH